MADNDFKRARRREEPEDKDDDPFAELARIVGSDAFEEPVKDSPTAGRHSETEPSLEAELLRELDVDASAAEPLSDASAEDFEQRLAEEITSFQDHDDHRADGFASSEAAADALDSEMLSELLAVDHSEDVGSGTEGQPVEAAETSDTAGDQSITGLEAELDAAFAALEQGVSAPRSEAEESVSKDEQPADAEPAQPAIAESEAMAEAYRAFEDDIDAAMPKAAQLDEAADDVNDMLLAEMIDVEAEGAGAKAAQQTPFDPADIAESDDVPEPMEELHIPQLEPDDIIQSPSEEDDFSLPLQEELEALASDAPTADAAARRGTETDENWLERPIVDEDVGEPVKAASAAASDSNDPPRQYHSPLSDGGGLGSDDDLAVQEFDVLDDEEDEPRARRRGIVAALVVLGVAIVGGAGFYVWNTGLGGQSGSDEPPVIAANDDPVKVKPDNPGGKTVPNQDLAVYDRVAGNDSSTTEQQNLVNTTEEPVDVVQRTLSPETLPLEGRANSTETAQKSEDRLAVANNSDDTSSADDAPVTGVEPRKVRTLVVKPDGTIVARELPETETAQTTDTSGSLTAAGTLTAAPGAFGTAVAGEPSAASTLSTPADAAGVNAAGTASSGTSTDTTASGATTDSQVAADDTTAVLGEEVADTTSANTAGAAESGGGETLTAAESAVSGNGSGAASDAPVPASRPADQTETVADQTETAVAAAAVTSSAADTAAVPNPGGYLMQISSQPTEAGARQSYETLSQRYASIIGDRGVTFQRADIPDRGIFYRVRIPAGTRAEANDLCNRYKAAGGSCFVAR